MTVKNRKEMRLLRQMCLVANPLDRRINKKVRFIVDTGAESIVIPSSLAQELKLQPFGTVEGVLADGTVCHGKLAWIHVTIDGHEGVAMAVIIDNAEPLLGLEVLKMFNIYIDTAGERLLTPVKMFRVIRYVFNNGVLGSHEKLYRPSPIRQKEG